MIRLKLLIIFVLIYGSCFTIKAQSYQPFPDSAKWRVSACGGPPNYPYSCLSRDYFTSGDTTIGAYSYKKVYLTDANVHNRIAAGIRNDVPAKKIYGIYFLNLRSSENFNSSCLDFSFYNIDTLLCDFSKIQGDSMNLSFLGGGCSDNAMWSKDKVYEYSYEYGTTQLRALQVQNSSLNFYEGIGCAEGIFELSLSSLGYQYTLEEGLRTLNSFTDFSNDQEFIFTETLKGQNEALSALIPNPVTTSATLQLGVYVEEGTFMIEDIRGNTIQQQNISGVNELPITTKGISPGIYFWRLKDENGKWYSGKMIIE